MVKLAIFNNKIASAFVLLVSLNMSQYRFLVDRIGFELILRQMNMSTVCIGNCPPSAFYEANDLSALKSENDALVTAIYLARSGTRVSLLCAATESNVGAVKSSLQLMGIDSDLVSGTSIEDLFSDSSLPALKSKLENYDFLHLTGKILSELSNEGRDNLLKLLKVLKASEVKIVFDCNHQSTTWKQSNIAAEVYQRFLSVTDISLPNSLEEAALFKDKDVHELIARHHRLGVAEIVVKNGQQANWLSTKPEKAPKEFPIEQVQEELDATGAGEAFNAAYLATRLSGKTYCGSIKQGQLLASCVVKQANLVVPE